MGRWGIGLITILKAHRNRVAMAVLIKMRFEFTLFFNLQNIVKTSKSSQYKLEGGLITVCPFFLFIGRLAYNLWGGVAGL